MILESVTIFGEADLIGLAVADEISARGTPVHLVSVETAWLRTARASIADVSTAAGVAALRSLLDSDRGASGADALVVLSRDVEHPESLRSTCRRCAHHRGVSLLWHGLTTEPRILAEKAAERIEHPGPPGEVVEERLSDATL